MRKNLTLLIAGILLLATAGVAQAQAIYEVRSLQEGDSTDRAAPAEQAGAVVLFLRSGMHDGGTVTVTFSAPLAEGTLRWWMRGTTDPEGRTKARC